MLLNKPRAYAKMDAYGLDGLIAVNAHNIYYLTDYWGPLMRMRRTFYNYALLPRQEDAPAAIILTGVEHMRLHYNPQATWVPNRCSYIHPVYQDRRDFDPDVEDPEAVADGMKWPVSHDTLSSSDEAFLAYVTAHKGKHSVNALYALKRAIVEAGLQHGRLGSDDPRIGPWLGDIGLPDVNVVEATAIFREIRMVKSADEIELMREASRINTEALNFTINALQVGMKRTDLEVIYNTELAKRGSRGVYLATGQSGTNNNLGLVVPHETITFDGLNEYKNYHGDLGRVAVIGEPKRDVLKRMDAVKRGCRVAYDMIRPGVMGRDVTEAVLQEVRGAGFPGFFFATPHSVGLEHTDHPLPIGPMLPGSQPDFMFEEGMIFSLDMPYYEIGWGNLHVEDSVLVTRTGVECLNDGDVSLRVIPL
jgi:Xaa-Pro aminopeptidase